MMMINFGAVANDIAAHEAFAAVIAPPSTLPYTNRLGLRSIIPMNARNVPAKIMLATKCTPTGTMRAHVCFNPVGIVGFHVGFEIECPVKSTGTRGTLEFLAVPFVLSFL